MKYTILAILLTSNIAIANSGDIFKGAELAAKYQCSEGIKEYDFVSIFATLYQFDPNDNISHDEGSIRKLKEVSDFVQQNIQDTCKNKKYLAGGWDFQGCMNKCLEAFNKKERLKYKCVSTCASLKDKIDSLPFIMGGSISKKIVYDNSKCKETNKSKIDNSGRNKAKDTSGDAKNIKLNNPSFDR